MDDREKQLLKTYSELVSSISEPPETSVWTDEDLPEIWSHLLELSPSQLLAEFDPLPCAIAAQACEQSTPPIRTLSDLFLHRSPPQSAVQSLLDFISTQQRQASSHLPEPILKALLSMLILCRLRNHGGATTSEMEECVSRATWLAEQPWLNEEIRQNARERRALIIGL